MEEVRIYKKPNVIKPAMIAGWPGMGNVALGAVDHLRKELNAAKFAEIMVDQNAALDSVVVEEGLARFPAPPKNTFYYSKDYDLVIFEGEAQIQGVAGINLLTKVLDISLEFRVSKMYTGAAFPVPISHKDASDVYAAANNKRFRDTIAKSGTRLMEGGHISGLNGLLLGFAEKKGIDAACLLATIPQYAIGIPNPKASLAIIEALSKLLSFQIDPHAFSDFIRDMDEKMALIEDKVKDVFSVTQERPISPGSEKRIPGYVMERVEKMFQEARVDRKKALALKRELDRWDLYKLYEDRFLDLFKDSQ